MSSKHDQSSNENAFNKVGRRSKMVITGDLTQVDLPEGQISGLSHSIEILKKIKGIEIKFGYF